MLRLVRRSIRYSRDFINRSRKVTMSEDNREKVIMIIQCFTQSCAFYNIYILWSRGLFRSKVQSNQISLSCLQTKDSTLRTIPSFQLIPPNNNLQSFHSYSKHSRQTTNTFKSKMRTEQDSYHLLNLCKPIEDGKIPSICWTWLTEETNFSRRSDSLSRCSKMSMPKGQGFSSTKIRKKQERDSRVRLR